MPEETPRSPWKYVGCTFAVLVLLFGGCIVGVGGGVRLLSPPPAFHNRVYRNDRMLFHNWQLDGVITDGKGAAILVDLQREYVLCMLSGPLDLGSSSSYRIDHLAYSIDISGGGTVAGVVKQRTLEVVDLKTRKRTTTMMSAGDAYEWKAAMERTYVDGNTLIDYRAMLIERGIALP
jgi:hypothetical protein